MNDMPVPKGDFKFLYSERQRIHNTVLGIGISMLGTGLFLVIYIK